MLSLAIMMRPRERKGGEGGTEKDPGTLTWEKHLKGLRRFSQESEGLAAGHENYL